MEFKWLNEGKIQKNGNRIEITAPAQTDFFCGSIDECEEGILPVDPIVKVGLLAQAPVGKGGVRVYENLSIQKLTVKNIRTGK